MSGKTEQVNNVVTYNQQIVVHANRKELVKAKEIFQQVQTMGIANKHTYSIMMNAAIRCGQLTYAREIFDSMKSLKYPYYKDVVIYTTLIKGYCSQQLLYEAYSLYQEMTSPSLSLCPNIRTINTILRGCLQTGHLQLAELITANYQKDLHGLLDISGWEYLLYLCCQQFQWNKVYPIIGRLKKELLHYHEEYQLIGIYLALIKSLVLIQDWKGVAKWKAQLLPLYDDYEKYMIRGEESREKKEVPESTVGLLLRQEGGKRGKKSSVAGSLETAEGPEPESKGSKNHSNQLSEDYSAIRREESLLVYRQHLLEEWKYELDCIQQNHQQQLADSAFNAANTLTNLLSYYSRVLIFDQERVTFDQKGLQASSNPTSPFSSHPCSLYYSYHLLNNLQERLGFKQLFLHFSSPETGNKLLPFPSSKECSGWYDGLINDEFHSIVSVLEALDHPLQTKPTKSNQLAKKKKHSKENNKNPTKPNTTVTPRVASQADSYLWPIIQSVKSYFSPVSLNQLSLPSLFAHLPPSYQRQYKLEICSGNGDWAIEQARHDPENAWLTLELRTDRVYQTVYKAYLNQVSNLVMMSGNAWYILPYHLPSQSFDYLFINHPEPPQQISAQIASDADHLLTARFFQEVERLLLPETGKVTIVTDNLWYGKFLVYLLAEAIHRDRSLSFLRSYQATTAISNQKNSIAEAWKVEYSEEDIMLYEGEPGVEAGHVSMNASSYFDRLWKRNELKKRYFIVLIKTTTPVTIKKNPTKLKIPAISDSIKTVSHGSISEYRSLRVAGEKRKHIVFEEEETVEEVKREEVALKSTTVKESNDSMNEAHATQSNQLKPKNKKKKPTEREITGII